MTGQQPRLVVTVVLGLVALAAPIYAEQEPTRQEPASLKPVVGFVKTENNRRSYNLLTFNFGVERWENGTKSDNWADKWRLQCFSDPLMVGGPPNTCTLERTVFHLWSNDLIPEVENVDITRANLSSLDGGIQVTLADWANGHLDLRLVYPGEPPIEVSLDLEIPTEDAGHDSIFLNNFIASSRNRGSFAGEAVLREYRIVEYDYTLQVPVDMPGLREREGRR